MLPLLQTLPRVHFCFCIGMLALATDSRADAVLLRFQPASQSGVAGYDVYFAPQTTGPITSAPVDMGAQAPDSSGLASFMLSGLDPTQAYSFELTAYDAKGAQSPRSNRMNLAARTEVLGSVLWSNDFSSYAPGVHVPGFVDSVGGVPTDTGTGLFEVAYFGNDPAYGTDASAGSVSSDYLGWPSKLWGSVELSGRVWTSSNTAWARILLRDTPGDEEQSFVFGQLLRGAWAVWGINEPALSCAGSSSTGVVQPPMSWYSFRVRVTRASGLTRVRAMIWPTGTASAATWQVDCWTTLSAGADSGAFGLLRAQSGSAYFDDLAVTAVTGTLEPIPPQ